MEDLARFEQLLRQGSFKSLDEKEKGFALKFVSSEGEYESLRNAEVELKSFFDRKVDFTPNKNTWLKIKQARAEKMQLRQPFSLTKSIPAYAVVLLTLIVGATAWWSGSTFGSKRILVERIVSRVDTIRITSKPDTVVKEKVIYLHPTKVSIVSIQPDNEPVKTKGVNMKDKEELEGLLVSGSY